MAETTTSPAPEPVTGATRDIPLPGPLRALWRAMAIAYRAEPKLLIVTFALTAGSMIPEALAALWLKLLAEGVTESRTSLITGAAAGLALSGAAGWLMRIVGDRVHFLFRERATIEIEAHVVRLQAEVASIEHHERPEYLDRLQILKDYSFLLNHLYGSFMNMVGTLIRLGITVVLLLTVHPALILLAAFSLPTIATSSWRAGVQRKTEEAVAPRKRLAKHLFDVGTMAGPAKEVRITRTERQLVAQRRQTWEEWFAPVSRARWKSAFWHSGAWALFGLGYVGGIVFVAAVLQRPAGDVLLTLAAGANLSRYLGATAGQADFLRWCLDAARSLAWLERYADSHQVTEAVPPPPRLHQGIHLEGVSFVYPGTSRTVLQDVTLDLPAGSVVAIVGENGAGKTTLVKLLSRFYEPTSGTITVDDIDLSRIDASAWRARTAGAYQDFMRYEFLAETTVGVGDLPRADEVVALERAVDRGGAGDVVGKLPSGLQTQLGPQWEGGVELSFGQWQKLALARGFMRDDPLLLILDEPTAALDAETEHQLFERFAAASRDAQDEGRITVLVSHRFSTVRMADLIVVLDGARVTEIGTHEELIRRGGTYAELYGIQARAYR